MLSKVWRRLCDLTAGKTRPCDAGNAMTRAFDIGRSAPMSDADAPSVAGNILRLLCEISAGPSHSNDQAARPGPGEKSGVQKREAPAVAGPGLSCRGVTTILADRDVAP